MSKHTDYNPCETMRTSISLGGFKGPTPIQQTVIPLAYKGRDTIDISDMGTGKTYSFLIPIMERVDSSLSVIQTVITAPTRELALQIYSRCEKVSKADPRLRIRSITGGIEESRVNKQLKVQPYIVVGTLGRIKDLFLQEQILRVDITDIMVVDEADITLEFSFPEGVDAIAGKMEKNLQMMSFSATISVALQQFLKKYMDNPSTIHTQEQSDFHSKIKHVLIPCQEKSYEEKLTEPLATFAPYVCLILTNTRTQAASAAEMMRDTGYGIIELHGNLTPRERTKAMRDLVDVQKSYVVATDITARGTDIGGISHVISLGSPKELDYYIHRSGRTGHADRDGICYALYRKQGDTMIRSLEVKGVGFKHHNLKNGTWSELEPLHRKEVKEDDPLEKEIPKIVSKRRKKVKPGYKVKRKQEVEKLKRKARHQMIQKDTQRQKKGRARRGVTERRGGQERSWTAMSPCLCRIMCQGR